MQLNNTKQVQFSVFALSLSMTLSIALKATASIPVQTPIYLDQGWTESDRANTQTIDEGSRIMPLRWFLNLEVPQSRTKLSETMEQFGLVKSPDASLPYGMVIGEDTRTEALYKEKQWMGFNCTACHTSNLNINGQRVQLEGGSSLFDIQGFEGALLKSVSATLKSRSKLNRLASRLNESDIKDLYNRLSTFNDEFGSWVKRNHRFYDSSGQPIGYGPSRIDGLGGGTNDLTCQLTPRLGDPTLSKLISNPSNCRNSNPPSSIPHLWGINELQFVQWNGGVHSSLGRNFGQSTATYGKNWISKDEKTGAPYFESTANIENLFRLEQLYAQLKAPKWSELSERGLVKAIDLARKSRGESLYAQNCASCHAITPRSTAPNKFGNSYWETPVFAAATVGTDGSYLEVETSKRAFIPAPLQAAFKKRFGENSIAADGSASATQYRSLVIGSMILGEFERKAVPLPKQAVLTNCRDSAVQQTTIGYKARPLDGIIWTAPYLHNGSVPTLWDLLQPAQNRPRTFAVGCRDYDTVKMGFDCSKEGRSLFHLNTTLYGNSNHGHEYGTRLSEAEKWDIIEYIKTLETPDPASPKNPGCH